jgi:hypothetical protein
MSRRTALAVLALLVVATAGVIVASLPNDGRLTPLEQHQLDEERQEQAMLVAPPDTGRQFLQEPPYPSRNSDGVSGSGGKAVAYRTGARRVDTPDVVAAAPESRLWRTGFGSWEPTIGINRRGTVFFSARNTNADPGVAISDDGGRTWRRSKPQHGASLDPYIWVDEQTGSIFASDIDPPITCTPISRSDDDGRTWRLSRACGVTDHQNHFGGPPPPNGAKPQGYPNVLYYCAISGGLLSDTSTFSACLKSLDGGTTWEPTGDPAYPPKEGPDTAGRFCNGAVGHGIVDNRGTVFVPRGWCGPPSIAISKDEGATWTRREVSDKRTPDFHHETGVAADSAGNLFYVFVGSDHRAYLAISRDSGNTWEDERDITPPGVNYVSAFAAHADAGAPGRIAYVFMGTPDAKPGDQTRWAAYIGSSQDALAPDPLFYAAPANDMRTNTLWKGTCDDLRCGNIGDFLDVEIGPDGSAWVALVDSCPGNDECITDLTIDTPRGEGVVGQLVGGRPLVGTVGEQQPGIVLPSAGSRRSCRSRRSFSIRLREPRRGRLAEARVYVNGKRVRLVRGRRLRARVNLRGLPKGRYTVRVVAVTSTGQRVTRTRRYRTCTPKRRR